jgi:hypothetical protein
VVVGSPGGLARGAPRPFAARQRVGRKWSWTVGYLRSPVPVGLPLVAVEALPFAPRAATQARPVLLQEPFGPLKLKPGNNNDDLKQIGEGFILSGVLYREMSPTSSVQVPVRRRLSTDPRGAMKGPGGIPLV